MLLVGVNKAAGLYVLAGDEELAVGLSPF